MGGAAALLCLRAAAGQRHPGNLFRLLCHDKRASKEARLAEGWRLYTKFTMQ